MSEQDILSLINTVLGSSGTSLYLKAGLLAIVGFISVYFIWKKSQDANAAAELASQQGANQDLAGTAPATGAISTPGDSAAGEIDSIQNQPRK